MRYVLGVGAYGQKLVRALKSHKKGDPYGGPIFLQMEPSYVGNGQSLGLAYGSI
jgi:hypothetical protein